MFMSFKSYKRKRKQTDAQNDVMIAEV